MMRSRLAPVILIAAACAGCDVVLERERDGVRGEGRREAPIPPGTAPRGRIAYMAALAPPGPVVDMALLQRGRERYAIFCTPCHGENGHGNGPVVRRGFPAAASFHSERLRQDAPAQFVAIMTTGRGPMPSYAGQIAPNDLWAIAYYVKALQLSQHFPAELLSGKSQERAP